MQKWEYCEIELSYDMGVSGKGWIYKPDGKHKELQFQKYGAGLAQLGLEGWEIVASSNHAAFGQSKSNTVSYMLKRPIE